jgi:hypothetical protein
MSDTVRVRIPRALYEAVEVEAARSFVSPVGFLGVVFRAYLDGQKPKAVEKPVRLTAAERKQQEKEERERREAREDNERMRRFNNPRHLERALPPLTYWPIGLAKTNPS